MVPAGSHRISRVPRYSGAPLGQSAGFGYGAFTRCGATFQWLPLPLKLYLCREVLQPRRCRNSTGLGSSAFARHYLRNHCYFLFLRVMRCFSSPGSPPLQGDAGIASGGLPHSEIHGSMVICTLPWLIAAYHVLLRLREPRYPSCALVSFPWFLFVVYFCTLRLFNSLSFQMIPFAVGIT